MAKDKFPVQASGGKAGSEDAETNGRAEPGESGGGAYPNSHDNRKAKGKFSSFLGRGGQSEQDYYGANQIGGEKVDKGKGRSGQGG